VYLLFCKESNLKAVYIIDSLLYLYPFAVGFVVVICDRKEVQTFWSQDRKENIK
jgi:hypothetical protein